MKILALVGSIRKNGNSEILAKEALMYCREKGAEVSLLRITDLNIKDCRGCLSCLDPSKSCPQKDDIYFLIDQINKVDGLILSIPTYNYNLSGPVKTVQDRCLGVANLMQKDVKVKKGFLIVTGSQDGLGIAPVMGEMLLMSFLIQVIGTVQFTGCYGPGSAIIKNPDKMSQLKKLSTEITENTDSINHNLKQNCPFCSHNIFSIHKNQVQCPFCGRAGFFADEQIVWNDSEVNFTEKDFIDFANEHGPELQHAFLNDRERLFEILRKYKDTNCGINWITAE